MNDFTSMSRQISDSFIEVVDKLIAIIPDVIGALIVLIVGAFLSKLISQLVGRILSAIKLDHWVERFGLNEKMKRAGIHASVTNILVGLVYWVLFLIFISAATEVLDIAVVTKFINEVISWLPNIFAGLAVMIVGVMVADKLGNILANVRHGQTYKTVVRWFILVVAFITAVEQIGLDVSFLTENIQTIVAGISLAFGIAFGLGGKDRAKAFLDKHLS